MRTLGVYLDDTVPDYLSVSFSSAYIVDAAFAEMTLEEVQERVFFILVQEYDLDPETVDTQILANSTLR